MSEAMKTAAEADELLSVRITRKFAASPTAMFDAWTKPELIEKWWGPANISARTIDVDAQPGGALVVELDVPGEGPVRMSCVFLELRRPDLICFEIRHKQFEGADKAPGGYIPTTVEVQFAAHQKGTKLTLIHTGFLAAAQTGMFSQGWAESLDKLEELASAGIQGS